MLRNGKAKKNEPPVPADLAPISGSGKRVRREEPKDEPVRLDPIRFRYSTEAVVEEKEEEATEEIAEQGQEGKSRSRRRRKPKAEDQNSEAAPKQEQPPKEKKEQPRKETPKKDYIM